MRSTTANRWPLVRSYSRANAARSPSAERDISCASSWLRVAQALRSVVVTLMISSSWPCCLQCAPMKDAKSREYILTLSCPDATGIVHAVSGLLFQAGCNIVDSQQFGDVEDDDATGRFFMRVHFAAPPQLSEIATLEALFGHARQQFGMTLRLHARDAR